MPRWRSVHRPQPARAPARQPPARCPSYAYVVRRSPRHARDCTSRRSSLDRLISALLDADVVDVADEVVAGDRLLVADVLPRDGQRLVVRDAARGAVAGALLRPVDRHDDLGGGALAAD